MFEFLKYDIRFQRKLAQDMLDMAKECQEGAVVGEKKLLKWAKELAENANETEKDAIKDLKELTKQKKTIF